MSDKKFRCNHCGAEIVVDDTIVSSGDTCMYCGEGILIEEPVEDKKEACK